MKFVGIIKEHESGTIKVGQSISSLNVHENFIDRELENILNYLKDGTVVIAFLHYIYSDKNDPICPLVFYTDGKWVWPSYLAYYIKEKYFSLLSEEFIDDMRRNNFIVPVVSKERIRDAEKLYVNAYDPDRKGR